MPTWSALDDELDRWAAAGDIATFWWRDDDAGRASAPLRRLLAMRRALDVPLAVAAVPAWLDPDSIALLAGEAIDVLQHGWDHADHASPGAKRLELGGTQSPDDAMLGLGRGRATFGALPNALPILVPPWNRIADGIIARLAGAGFVGLSRFGPRGARDTGLVDVNSHIDIVAWHHGRGFVGESAALTATIDHLRARRMGAADRAEPTGLLTHHAVHDEPAWRFVERFAAALTAHGAARWVAARAAFGCAP
jgi:peptidoglycan/xylan/chitin deacetylase (PgdA/CDA1 family)